MNVVKYSNWIVFIRLTPRSPQSEFVTSGTNMRHIKDLPVLVWFLGIGQMAGPACTPSHSTGTLHHVMRKFRRL